MLGRGGADASDRVGKSGGAGARTGGSSGGGAGGGGGRRRPPVRLPRSTEGPAVKGRAANTEKGNGPGAGAGAGAGGGAGGGTIDDDNCCC